MGYLTAKQFSEKWGISERRIIKLCGEGRINGALKDGMIWQIPENSLKPSDKRSNTYKYVNTQKRVMIVNLEQDLNQYLIELLTKQGYIVDCENFNYIKDNLDKVNKYYEGLIYFSTSSINKNEELFIINFAEKMNSKSSIVIVDYLHAKSNNIEKKLKDKLKENIGVRINRLTLDISKENNVLINYNEISEDIVQLLINFKNTSGIQITTDGGKIEFNKNGRSENLNIGKFYKAINNYFKNLKKDSYLWCASMMLEDEWTDSPQEMKFRLINLEVANRGIKFERIFIFSKDKIKEFKKNKTLKIYMQSNIKTMFVDYDEVKQKNPNLLKIVKDGWDGIDKSTLIVDLPEGSEERGYFSKNTKEVLKAYNCFQELKKYSKNLKEVLK